MKTFILSLTVWAVLGLVAAFLSALFGVPTATTLVVGVAVLGLRAVVLNNSNRYTLGDRKVSPVLAAIIIAATVATTVTVINGTAPVAMLAVTAALLLTRHWATREIDSTICEVNLMVTSAADWVGRQVSNRRAPRLATIESEGLPMAAAV